MASDPLFLDDGELHRLTGRSQKSRQIEWLRAAGVPFRVNATGHPVVTRAAVEGKQQTEPEQARGWTPRVIGA
jgi:hypothetical protein